MFRWYWNVTQLVLLNHLSCGRRPSRTFSVIHIRTNGLTAPSTRPLQRNHTELQLLAISLSFLWCKSPTNKHTLSIQTQPFVCCLQCQLKNVNVGSILLICSQLFTVFCLRETLFHVTGEITNSYLQAKHREVSFRVYYDSGPFRNIQNYRSTPSTSSLLASTSASQWTLVGRQLLLLMSLWCHLWMNTTTLPFSSP